MKISQETENTGENQSAKPPLVKAKPDTYFCDWLATLATVFLSGATLSIFMRWCSYGAQWDLGAGLFSGVLAWVCYRLTLSEKAFLDIKLRLVAAIILPVVWAGFLPLILWGLGFK